MNARSPILWWTVASIAAVAAGYLHWQRSLEKTAVASLRTHLSQLERQRHQIEQDRAAVGKEIAAADETLRAAMQPVWAVGVDEHRVAGVAAWLARVKKVKQSFADRPDQQIPELALLTDMDWVAISQMGDSESDLRRARSDARHRAVAKMIDRFTQALRKHYVATANAPVRNMTELLPYISPPVDPAILARYELQLSRDAAGGTQITEKTAIDPDLDLRHSALNGGFSSGPWSAGALAEPMREARARYRAEHQGNRPASQADYLPYVSDPAARAVLTAMDAYSRSHYGLSPVDVTELLPYVSDPAARALIDRMHLARTRSMGE